MCKISHAFVDDSGSCTASRVHGSHKHAWSSCQGICLWTCIFSQYFCGAARPVQGVKKKLYLQWVLVFLLPHPYMCVCVCSLTLIFGIILYCFLPYLLRYSVSVNLVTNISSRLGRPASLWDPPPSLCPGSTGVTEEHCYTLLLHGCWTSKLR